MRAWVLILCCVLLGAVIGAAAGYSARTRSSRDAITITVTRPVASTHATSSAHPRARSSATQQPARTWLDPHTLTIGVAKMSRSTGAMVGVAIRDISTGSLATAGPLQTGNAWSTIKIPLVMASYRLAERRGRGTTTTDALAERAIRASDNDAAAQLFETLASAFGGVAGGSRYVQDELVAANDRKTVVNTIEPPGGFSTYGQTQWSLPLGTLFFRALARHCIPPADETLHVLGLMSDIESDQRWGIGTTNWRGATLIRFKGGWGPGRDGKYLVRQFGIIEDAARRGVVVGLIVKPGDGSFTSGVADITRLAAVVSKALRFDATAAASTCR